MGWCHEFGQRITEGCDHAMVAAEDHCTCPDCGTVCHGRFAGCAQVWRSGPVDVLFSQVRRPGGYGIVRRELVAANGATPDPGRANGGAPGSGRAALPVGALVPISSAGEDTGSSARGNGAAAELRTQVDILKRRLDHLASAVVALEVENPSGTRAEIKRAMEEERALIMRELDARFDFLVRELSERLVVLGNEVVSLKRRMADPS